MSRREREQKLHKDKEPSLPEHVSLTFRERAFSNTTTAQIIAVKDGQDFQVNSLKNRYAPIWGKRRELSTRTQRQGYSYEGLMQELSQYGSEDDSEKMLFIKQNEAELMASLLFQPSTEQETIELRQNIFRACIGSSHLDKLIEIKKKIFLLLEGVHQFNSQYSQLETDERTLIEMLYDGETELKIYDYEWDDPRNYVAKEGLIKYVRSASRLIRKGLEGLRELQELQDPAISTYWPDLPLFITEVKRILNLFLPKEIRRGGKEEFLPYVRFHHFFDNGYLNEVIHFTAFLTFQDKILDPFLLRLGAVLEISKRIRDEKWCEVTFDPQLPLGYTQGFNLEMKKEDQVFNDSLPHQSFSSLTGANSSGKSFTLSTEYLIQISAQAFGFAPAQQANVAMYATLAYLDRSASTSVEGLSAFMQEVTYLKRALDKITGKPIFFIDEGFSTTSPEHQMRLLLATVQYITERDGRVIVATHNDILLDEVEKHFPDSLFHLGISINSNGEFERSFVLRPGRDDSYSFVVAQKKNFPEPVLVWTQSYLQGSQYFPISEKYSEDYLPVAFEPSEREAKKKSVDNLDYLFSPNLDDPLFHCFSNDTDWQAQRIFFNAVERVEEKPEDVMWDFLFNVSEKEELAGVFVLSVSSQSSEEILERQQLFRVLKENDTFLTIRLLVAHASQLDSTLRILRNASMKNLSRLLNPLESLSERNVPFSEDKLRGCVGFLSLQEKIGGKNFAQTDLFISVRSLFTYF